MTGRESIYTALMGFCRGCGHAPLEDRHTDNMSDWKRPPDFGRPDPMPAAEQLASAATQLAWNERSLEGASWAVHPRDLEELRSVIGEATQLHELWFTIAADPELEGFGVRLIWADEWPESWT